MFGSYTSSYCVDRENIGTSTEDATGKNTEKMVCLTNGLRERYPMNRSIFSMRSQPLHACLSQSLWPCSTIRETLACSKLITVCHIHSASIAHSTFGTPQLEMLNLND